MESDELAALTRRFEDHLEDYRVHIAEDDARYKMIIDLQRKNTEAISHLTKSTQGLVDSWRFAKSFTAFARWLSTITIMGVAFIWLYKSVGPTIFKVLGIN